MDMSKNFDSEKIRTHWVGNMSKNFSKVITHFSENSIYEKCMEEWDIYDVGLGSENVSERKFCICSHDITECYYIKNNINGNILRVGSDCILKFMPADFNRTFKEYMKRKNRLERVEKGEKPNRWCSGCKRHSISYDAPAWKTKCKKCYIEGRDSVSKSDKYFNRECTTCKKFVISKEEPEWKKKCYNCYLEENESEYRECATCKKFVISKEEPEWKKKCYDCYKNHFRYLFSGECNSNH